MSQADKPSEFAILSERVSATAKKIGPVATAAVAVSAIFPVLGSIVLFARVNSLTPLVEKSFWAAAAIYALAFGLTTGLAIMPTYALAGCAGFLFGAITGSGVAAVGITTGALVGYAAGRLIVSQRVMAAIQSHERASTIRKALVDRDFWSSILTVGLIRFPPNSPFALTNLVMSAVRVPILSYALGSPLGMLPRTILAAALGAGIRATTDQLTKEDLRPPIWLIIAGVIALIAVFLILQKVFSQWIAKAFNMPSADSIHPAQTSPEDKPGI